MEHNNRKTDITASENVNEKKLPANELIEKVNTGQKKICGNVTLERDFSRVVSCKKSSKITKKISGTGLVEGNSVQQNGEEINTNVYNNGELVSKIDV